MEMKEREVVVSGKRFHTEYGQGQRPPMEAKTLGFLEITCITFGKDDVTIKQKGVLVSIMDHRFEYL